MRQLRRRCGALTAEQVAHIRSLARLRLEALAEALALPLLPPAEELCRFLEASIGPGRRGPLPAQR